MIGKTLGHYEIIEQIGAGGMGEVYRARDVRLDRTVAVKVLPSHFAESPERLQRFEREARTISSLSHPGICTLYDLGHEEDTHFLVMEYLEGETLAQRLQRGSLPMKDVLRFGADIAAALDQAHRAGIIHRDLKPGNIMMTADGVKLLDFGLAKMAGRDEIDGSLYTTVRQTSPHPDTPLTAQGTILGTFQYMAPEQLEGSEADARSDIFALGSVLYEMATGRRAFEGKSQASLIAAILERDPAPMSSLQPLTPPAFDHAVRKCLAKKPDDRWQSARDLAGQLRWVAEESSVAGVPRVVTARRKNRERIAWGVAAVSVLAAAAAMTLWMIDRPPPPEVSRFEIPIPDGIRFASRPRISPDGRHIAFTVWDSSGPSIWIRSLETLEARPVVGTEGADWCFWSPDSRQIAFMAGGKLRKLSVSGGPAQTVGDAPSGDDGSWTDSGDILFDGDASEGGISRISSSGGIPKPATPADSASAVVYGWPEALPSGRHFLCLAIDPDQDAGEFQLVGCDLRSSEMRRLGNVGSRVHYAEPGYLLSVTEGTLVAQPFDAKRLDFTGEPVPLAEDIDVNQWGGVPFSISRNGVLVYRTAYVTREQLVWRDRNGRETARAGEPARYDHPAASPDGKRVAVVRADPDTDREDLWVLDTDRGTASRVTFMAKDLGNAVWSPDGRSIAFSAEGPPGYDLFRIAASGLGQPDTLAHFPAYVAPRDWSKDGKSIAVEMWGGSETRANVYMVDATGKNEPAVVLAAPYSENYPGLSPDGRWLAYTSRESGRDEVYVRSYPGAEGKWQVSVAGGDRSRWSPDGRELLYLSDDLSLMAVEVTKDEGFRAGVPRKLFEVPAAAAAGGEFCLSPDGKQTLWIEPVEDSDPPPFTVVLNWTALLEKR